MGNRIPIGEEVVARWCNTPFRSHQALFSYLTRETLSRNLVIYATNPVSISSVQRKDCPGHVLVHTLLQLTTVSIHAAAL